MFSKTISVFILCLSVFLNATNPSTLNTIGLQKISCLRPTNVPVGLEFKASSTLLQCAFNTLQAEKALAMILKPEENGDLSCGFSNKIPLMTVCNDSTSNLTVFYSRDRLPVCPDPCLFHYMFLGVRYCILKAPDSKNYNDCNSYCNSVNGEMVEARSKADMFHFWDLVNGDDSVWFGGNDLAKAEEYRWNRGDLVNETLFHNGQPNHSEHHCLVLQGYIKWNGIELVGLNDLECSDRYICVCASICQD